MAGSLSHIVDDHTGGFRWDLIENMGDAYEMAEECYDIIAYLCGGDLKKLERACDAVGSVCPITVPRPGLRQKPIGE